MTINLNVNPYYDDFDETKNFHQILYKPGQAVQARELTQSQTILRDQVKKFGSGIYKHGSIVIPGNSVSDIGVPYIKIESNYGNTEISLSSFDQKTIVGESSGVEAIIKKSVASNDTDPIVFYLSYISGNVSTKSTSFQSGETIHLKESSNNKANLISTNATGFGSLVHINKGVYYVNGSFVNVPAQSEIMSKFDVTPSCHVLLKIDETIVTAQDDVSLLDPALGSYNYSAPGADRIKIDLTLVTLPLGSQINEDYIEIMRYNNGNLEEHAKNARYSELEKSLARRTYDESGNYVVDGLVPIVREHLKIGGNGGVYPNGTESKLVIDVSPGKAYIEGFEIEKYSSSYIEIDKARTSAHVKNSNAIIRAEYGKYIMVSDIVGNFSIYDRDTIEFYNDFAYTNVGATKIGTAKIMGIDYLDAGESQPLMYKIYISDVLFDGQYSLDNAGSIKYGANSGAYILTEYSAPVTANEFVNNEIISHSSGRTAKIKYWNPTNSTLYAYKHNYTKNVPNAGDYIVGATSNTVSTISSKKNIHSVGGSNLIFPLPKSAIKTFFNDISYDLTYTIQKELTIITDVSGDGSVSVSAGEVINPIETGTFTAIGTSGVLSNSLFSLNNEGTILSITGGPTSQEVKIYASVTKTNVSPKTKTLTTNSEVISNTNPIILSKCDIRNVVSVIDDIGDITTNYSLWNGQTDYAYTRGTLTLKSGSRQPIGNVTVSYSYYNHSTTGDFFCVDSYPAEMLNSDNYYASPTTGTSINLYSSIDFRPAVGINGEFTGSGSKRNSLILSGSAFNTYIEYYVPRIDTLCIDSSGNFSVLTGIPNESPVAQSVPSGKFPLNILYIPEYTKYATTVLNKRLDVERFTMKDIKNILNRVENVENYTTLTASELSVTTVEVVDVTTGLTKFKTGYLVEDFSEPLTIARTTSGEYSAIFVGGTMQPKMENLLCDLILLDTSTNYVNKKGYLMLPYTETVFAEQTLSSRVTNINPFLFVKWDGLLRVVPSSDQWTEIRNLPVIFETAEDYKTVVNYIDCPSYGGGGGESPSLPPLPATTYGGWYGEVVGRAGETAGVNWWQNDLASGQSVANIATNFLTAASQHYAGSTEKTLNPVSVSALASNPVLSSTTTYSYTSTGSIKATTTSIGLNGSVKTSSKIVK